MTILVVAEYEAGAVAPATLNTVAAAAKIGGDVHVLVAGQNVGGVAESAAKIMALPRCWWLITPPTPTSCRKTSRR